MTGSRPVRDPYIYRGRDLVRAGVRAGSDVVIRRHFQANELSTPDREDLTASRRREYDEFAAEVIAAYLATVEQLDSR